TIGVGGPVGSGKTALVERLCREFWPRYNLAVVTNDIYTKEDAEFLARREVLPLDRIVGVETGGCPHSAIREDASVNLAAIADLDVMRRDSTRMRGERPFILISLRQGTSVESLIQWVDTQLASRPRTL